MRKTINLFILSIIILAFSVLTATAQSANEIFKKYADAIGGKAAAEKITGRLMKGAVGVTPGGLQGTFEIYSKAPDKSLTIINLAGVGEILDGFDGKEGWAQSPIQGMR